MGRLVAAAVNFALKEGYAAVMTGRGGEFLR